MLLDSSRGHKRPMRAHVAGLVFRPSQGTFIVALSFVLSGCATVFEGTTQEISIVTNPSGAACEFDRQGMQVGTIANTPGTANIRKSKYDLTVRCTKPGYQEGQYLNHSGTTATIAANVAADLILTAGLSSIVDSADGADNKYDSVVNMTLLPANETRVAMARNSLGISGSLVTPASTVSVNMHDPHGVFVEVMPLSVAASAGLRPGDVILTYRGQRVGSLDELNAAVAAQSSGSSVELEIWRNSSTEHITLRF